MSGQGEELRLTALCGELVLPFHSEFSKLYANVLCKYLKGENKAIQYCPGGTKGLLKFPANT